MKMSKQFRIAALVLVGGIVVASSACSVDSTAPAPQQPGARPAERASQFVPTEAQKALVGVTDGTYRVTFNPQQGQVLSLGPNRLEIPANAVCNTGTSGYGPSFWNAPCTPETRPLTLTVTVKDANSDHPSVDFQPAMRFNPQTTVSLYVYVPRVTRTDAKNWVIQYCPSSGTGSGKCVNEALTDPDLRTFVDYDANVLFRRLKHFSRYAVDDGGYTVGE
jgi:hypothetical protein